MPIHLHSSHCIDTRITNLPRSWEAVEPRLTAVSDFCCLPLYPIVVFRGWTASNVNSTKTNPLRHVSLLLTSKDSNAWAFELLFDLCTGTIISEGGEIRIYVGRTYPMAQQAISGIVKGDEE